MKEDRCSEWHCARAEHRAKLSLDVRAAGAGRGARGEGSAAAMASAARQNVKNQVEGRVSEAMQAVHAPVPPKPSANAVLEQLLDIPLLDTLNRINAQVGGLQKQLTTVDFHVAKALNPPSSEGDATKQPAGGEGLGAAPAAAEESGGTFLTDVAMQEPPSKPRNVLEGTASQHGLRGVSAKDAKSVEHLPLPDPFPGSEPLELPGKLSANDLIKRVSDRWMFARAQHADVFSQCLASKESQNLIQDLFWWFFCERYRAGKKAAEQEALFKRMACNFVRLLTRVPHIHKDKFFDRFHSIMANSVFAAFRVALPESEELFDDKFRSDLCRLSAYWTTGADIGPSNFVLPNGQVVKEDTGRDQVEAVIQQLVREQAELEEMTDKRPSRHRGGPMTSGSASRPSGASASMAGGAGAGKSLLRAGKTGGGGTPRAGAQTGTQATARKGSPMTPGARPPHGPPLGGGTDGKPPPVPPLRLPVMKHIAQQSTPRTCWTERGVMRSCLPEATVSARPAPHTSRPAQRSPAGTTADATGTKRAMSLREWATGTGTAYTGTSTAALHQTHQSQEPTSGRSSSSSARPPHMARPEKDALRPVGAPAPGGGGKRLQRKTTYFDLRETSPLIRYYLMTQVTSNVNGKPEWKQLLSDAIMHAWERPLPPPPSGGDANGKKGTDSDRHNHEGEDEDEDEQLVDKVVLTPREIAEAAVKKNQRLVREYKKLAKKRGNGIRRERAQMQVFYRDQRDEMKRIIGSRSPNSLERAHVFGNLLVSTGGDSKQFELAWKKMGKDANKDYAD